MPKPRGRPPSAPRHRSVQVRVPIDLFDRIAEMRGDSGLSYSDIVIAALRRSFGVASPMDALNFNPEKN